MEKSVRETDYDDGPEWTAYQTGHFRGYWKGMLFGFLAAATLACIGFGSCGH
jgi:hypothetical protein